MQMKKVPKAEAEKPSGNMEEAETPGCSRQPAQVVLREGPFNTDREQGGTRPREGCGQQGRAGQAAPPRAPASRCGRCGRAA